MRLEDRSCHGAAVFSALASPESTVRCKQCFTPAYLLVLVERVDNQLHHAVHFSLEDMLFRLFSKFLDLRCIQSIQLDRLLLSKGSHTPRAR